jgi:hypothetical protein
LPVLPTLYSSAARPKPTLHLKKPGRKQEGGPVDTAALYVSCQAIYAVVQSGPYSGFTKAEMEAEWERYKVQLTRAGSRLVGSSVNGQSFQFGPRSDMSLTTWGRAIRKALSEVSPDFIAPSSQIAVRFGCG